jgi:hypothetical protein
MIGSRDFVEAVTCLRWTLLHQVCRSVVDLHLRQLGGARYVLSVPS